MDNFFNVTETEKLSYRYITGEKGVTLLFLHGTLSDKNASKSLFLEEVCKKNNIGYIALDFAGHGESFGQYEDATIGLWLQNALDIIDNITTDKLIVVGSSMGGWIGLLSTIHRPDRVKAFIGLATAADFTVDLWDSFTDLQKQEINENGILYIPNGWTEKGDPWAKELFQEAEKHLLLQNTDSLNISCPMTLIHGAKDDCVSVQTSLRILEKASSEKVKLILLKSSGHRLSEPTDLAVLEQAVTDYIK